MTNSSSSMATAISLLVRARNREAIAWEQLVELYGPLVLRWCGTAKIDAHHRADILQEVFSTVSQKLPGFDLEQSQANFRGWLWMVTRNKLIDHVRRQRRQVSAAGGSSAKARLESVADEPLDWNLPDEEPTSVVDLRELRIRAIAQVESEFEPATWHSFWRSVVDGLPTDMVARELNTTPANVRQARSRVLRRLRLQLGEVRDGSP
jgi:RNA polymerase sigma-70 factor (ECF subfamily)